MGGFIVYIIKSSLVLAFLVPLFMAFMSRETFHRVNRFVLLAIMLLALVLPAVNLGVESPFTRFMTMMQENAASTASVDIAAGEVLVGEFDVAAMDGDNTLLSTESSMHFDWSLLAFIVYMSGVALLLLRQVFVYVQMFRLFLSSRAVDASQYGAHGIRLRVHDGKEKPFSWFRWVVVSKEDMRDGAREILTHEAAHAHAGHSWDILFADAVIIMQWFNPLAWIAKSVLKDIHEFEADEAVISSGVNAKEYQLLIIKKAVGARLYSIANSFNHSLTKKRITMMCKEKSKKWRCAKALYILPVAAVAALSFSTVENANAEPGGKVNEFVANDTITCAKKDTVSMKEDGWFEVDSFDSTNPANDDPEKIYQVVEVQPEFPGGMKEMMKWLRDNIKYPEAAKAVGAEGRVIVRFVVKADGTIGDVNLMRSSGNESLDAEALRVVGSMPKWTPAMLGGKPVNVWFTLPVVFKHPKETPKIELKSGGVAVDKANNASIVVDGELYNSNVADINSQDIESITVVKKERLSADELKKYNAVDKDGVIFITMKKPHESKAVESKQNPAPEQMPEFPGGMQALMKFLQTNIKYPLEARNAQLQGKIYVQFVVKSDSSIVNVEVKKANYSFHGTVMQGSVEEMEKLFGEGSSVEKIDDVVVVAYANGEKQSIDTSAPGKHPAAKYLAAEAVRVVSVMPKWTPGMQDGKPVNVQYMLPVMFRLQ